VDVITVTDLAKTYRTPFRRKRVEALRGVSFTVARGEVFGFLGPNGAGKTTTIRCLMGLCAITGGKAEILGAPVPSRAARQRMGFLPEQPYFYDYLTVSELLDLGGRLFGMAAPRAGPAPTADRPGRPRPRPRPAAQEVLQGHAAAGRPGAGADQRPRAGRPRRADERPRSDRAQGGPRPDPRGARRRQDGVLLVAHPVGRRVAVRSGRDLRRRQDPDIGRPRELVDATGARDRGPAGAGRRRRRRAARRGRGAKVAAHRRRAAAHPGRRRRRRRRAGRGPRRRRQGARGDAAPRDARGSVPPPGRRSGRAREVLR
jgi:ABC-type sugar transport system ATPase subunit